MPRGRFARGRYRRSARFRGYRRFRKRRSVTSSRFKSNCHAFRPKSKLIDNAFSTSLLNESQTRYDNTGGNQTGKQGCFFHLNTIQEGVGPQDRLSRRLWMKSLKIDIDIGANSAVTNIGGGATPAAGQLSADTELRMLLVYDRQTNGVAPQPADILRMVSPGGSPIDATWAYQNQNTMNRFTILRDKFMKLPAYTVIGAAPNNQVKLDPGNSMFTAQRSQVHKYVKLGSLCTDWTDVVKDLSAVESGALYFIAFTDTGNVSGAAGTPVLTDAPFLIYFNYRMRFADYH